MINPKLEKLLLYLKKKATKPDDKAFIQALIDAKNSTELPSVLS